MIRFKPEVRIGFFTEQLGTVLAVAARWSARGGLDVEVNSINDGVNAHMAGSLHPFDLAIDLDTDGDFASDLPLLGEYLRRTLPPGFDVVLERDHVHVEYDVHRPALTVPK